jgi:putative MATE family efflux protein
MADAIIYLMISAFSFPFLAVYNACAALFRSMGNSAVTLKVSIIINLINIAGNAVCIFVLKMGVAGVALPSLISRAAGAIILVVLLGDDALTVHLQHGREKPNFMIIRRILRIGVPSGIENGIFQLGRVLVVSIISGFGTTQIAANGVANNLDSLGVIIGQAMNLAMITVIGRCVGANDEKQIRYYTWHLIRVTYISTAIINTVVLLNLPRILAIYGLSEETMRLAAELVWIHDGCAMLLWPLAFVLPNMLRACNDVSFTMIVSIVSMFTFRIGFSYLLGVLAGMGAVGVWIAMIIDWLFRIALFMARYFSGKWKRLCLAET